MTNIDPAIVEIVNRSTADDDDLDHVFCDCRGELVALCGADLTDSTINPDMGDDDLCVVCADLELQPCSCDEDAL